MSISGSPVQITSLASLDQAKSESHLSLSCYSRTISFDFSMTANSEHMHSYAMGSHNMDEEDVTMLKTALSSLTPSLSTVVKQPPSPSGCTTADRRGWCKGEPIKRAVEAAKGAYKRRLAGKNGSPAERKCPFHCACFCRSQTFQQTLVLMRHSERLDRVDQNYRNTPEGLKWPFDTPLSEDGIKLAEDVADELFELSKEAQFMAIACSPYRRCLETAAAVAKRLRLPVLIDQELGEVRDATMPSDSDSHRTGLELVKMVKSLGIKALNPVQEDGSFKLFGKQPVWPENLDDAKSRFLIRAETYIQEGAAMKHNVILVTHADAVVSMMGMLSRGGADITRTGFCARIIAKRTVKTKAGKRAADHGPFADQWNVSFKDFSADHYEGDNDSMKKYYEKLHIDACDEAQQLAHKRALRSTATDRIFADTLKDLGCRYVDAASLESPKDPSDRADGHALPLSGRSRDPSEKNENHLLPIPSARRESSDRSESALTVPTGRRDSLGTAPCSHRESLGTPSTGRRGSLCSSPGTVERKDSALTMRSIALTN